MANFIEITDFSAPELDVYARMNEVQLLNRHEPEKGIFIAESPRVIERALDAGYEPISLLLEQKDAPCPSGKQHPEDPGLPNCPTGIAAQTYSILSRCRNIPVYTAPFDVLTQLTGYQLLRGALCAMRRPPLPNMESICAGAHRVAVLENIMNPTNVGAIFRSAAALGIDAVLLTPGCSDPLYRRAIRVSMGTVFQVPWTYFDKHTAQWPQPGIARLKELGFKTAAMALKENSLTIEDPRLLAEDKLAIVLGTEGDGLAFATLADCDYTVRIPMAHGVDSLNVAAASAVAFWQLGRRG